MALASGQRAYVYLLFEHKSYPDRLTPLQLLGHQVRIWEQALRQEGRTPHHLTPIIPLVVYHGQRPWNVAKQFGDMFQDPEELRGYWPDFTYQLYDLSTYSEDEIRGIVLLRVALLAFKYIFTPDLYARLPEILNLLEDLVDSETGLEYLYTLLRYISQTRAESGAELREAVTAAFPTRGGEIVTTMAQRWVQQGIQQGREEGIQQGQREGLLAGIALGLELKFGGGGLQLLPEIHQIQDVASLRALHTALLTAETLDDLRTI